MDPNTSTNDVVDSLEDGTGIAEVYPNHSYYDHMELGADMHISTNDPNQLAWEGWEGSLPALYGGPYQQNSISTMNFNAQGVQTNESAVAVKSGGMFR